MYQPPWSPTKKNLNQDFVVGVDAGGTRIRAVLARATDGSPLTEGAAGPGNALTVPLPELTDHLVTAVAEAVPPELRPRVSVVVAGFAGAARTSPDEPGRLAADSALNAALRWLGINPSVTDIYGDVEVAFASAPGAPADGLALVAGTGAVAARITARACAATADGNGWLLGDDGSGFWIGRSAVQAALRMADGRGGPTMLAESVARTLLQSGTLPGTRPGSWSEKEREAYRMWLVPVVMAEPPVRLARLAPLVRVLLARMILREKTGQFNQRPTPSPPGPTASPGPAPCKASSAPTPGPMWTKPPDRAPAPKTAPPSPKGCNTMWWRTAGSAPGPRGPAPRFAGQGAPIGGRNFAETELGPGEFHEIHLPAPPLGFRGLVMADGVAIDRLARITGDTRMVVKGLGAARAAPGESCRPAVAAAASAGGPGRSPSAKSPVP
jgi:hypothetical protein